MPLAYLEEYLDAITAVPQQVQYSLGKLAELDSFIDGNRTELVRAIESFREEPASAEARQQVMSCLLQEIEKTALKKAVADQLLRNLSKQSQILEDDLQGFQEELKANTTTTTSNGPTAGKKQRTKRDECICNNKGRGEMVGCENPNCPSEWFHLSCMGLTKVPAGRWFCPECSKLARV